MVNRPNIFRVFLIFIGFRKRLKPGGGGGYFHNYVCILGMCRARDLEFPFRSISFSQITPPPPKKKSSPFYIFGADFAVPETIIFKISLISTRLSPPTAGSAQRRGLAAGQSASQTRPGSSGESHVHAQNGSSSFRSPAFSSSKRLKLVPEPRIFTLDRELVPEPGPIFHFAAAHTYQKLG